MSRKALELALEALKESGLLWKTDKAIKVLEEELVKPHQRTWEGLTEEQINILCGMSDISAAVISADLILKEKNT